MINQLQLPLRRAAVAAAAALPLFLLSSVHSVSPVAALALTWALALLAAVQPSYGLLVIAAFIPFSGALTGLLRVPVPWTEPLMLGALGGWLSGAAFRASAVVPAGSVRAPWILSLTIVAAAFAVELSVLQLFFEHYPRELVRFLHHRYIAEQASFPGIASSVAAFEGLLLFAWATEVARESTVRRALATTVVAGIAAVAALNLNRFAQIAIRFSASLTSIAELAIRLRINAPFSDVNAAGSMFIMGLPVVAALSLGTWRTRIAWTAVLLLMATGLWLTGSRTAIGMGVAMIVGALVFNAVRGNGRWSTRIPAISGIIAIAVAVSSLIVAYPDRFTGIPAAESASVRWEMAKTALRMTAEHPVFGIGIGRFYSRSSEFMSPALAAQYPHENAHNNFLQILAELGVVGFAAFVWLLIAPFGGARAGQPSDRALLIGLQIGAGAFLLTCLTGHPLLVRDTAYPFWILLGAMAAVPRPAIPLSARRLHLRRWALAATVLLIALSVGPRGQHDRSEADLEHVAFGVSTWRKTSEGEFIRDVSRHATFFVPVDAPVVQIPFQLSHRPSSPVVIRISWQGRRANEIEISDGEWHMLRLIVPRVQTGRFERVDLYVDQSGAPLLMGKPTFPGWTPSTR